MTTEKKDETAPAQPTLEQIVAQLAEQNAQLVKQNDENRTAINTLTNAIVELNKKIEAKPSSGNPSGSPDVLSALAEILKPKGGSLNDLAKQAESFVRVADALERFRHPSSIGVGEALLMRAGIRAIYPRYMTKAEIQKAEKMLGTWETLEEAEGEHPE